MAEEKYNGSTHEKEKKKAEKERQECLEDFSKAVSSLFKSLNDLHKELGKTPEPLNTTIKRVMKYYFLGLFKQYGLDMAQRAEQRFWFYSNRLFPRLKLN